MKQQSKRAPGRPKQEGEEGSVREIILHTAQGLFMEYGYEQVSLEQIARISGVTKASIYYYFPNKATLFTVAVTQMMVNIRRYTLLLLDRDAPLKERLQDIVEAYLQRPHIDFAGLMKEAKPALSEEQLEDMNRAEHAVHVEMAKAFSKATEEGELYVSNSLLAAHAFAAVMMTGNREQLRESFSDHRSMSQEIVNLFWFGVVPDRIV
ncbi:TetR/AcrR family transcriptional regulator [Bacillus horti]|uniref:AcrR family transcriptional regulator n=1 Tax=Caldalkalibacillus horti TaxID=77523 RepID=A0ABT9W2L1_9BACI|nr:TetR/AcrR family transcriptional regulator [Bacillus horti]MDQ0167299.1 AcrR family transcriptional regulator [Bacillus horti]